MSHTAVKVAHSFNLGGFRRPSELLCDITTATALSLDHTAFTHLHRANEMIFYKVVVGGAGCMKRLDFREVSELGRTIATSVDVSRRAYAHIVAADCAAERDAALEPRALIH